MTETMECRYGMHKLCKMPDGSTNFECECNCHIREIITDLVEEEAKYKHVNKH